MGMIGDARKEIECPKCTYIWKTKSKLIYVTCPSCQLKIMITGRLVNTIKRITKTNVVGYDLEGKRYKTKF